MYVLIFSPQFPRLFYWSTEASGAEQDSEAGGESYLRVEAELEDISTQTEPPGTPAPAAALRPTSLVPPHPSLVPPHPSLVLPQHPSLVPRDGDSAEQQQRSVLLWPALWLSYCLNMCASNKRLLMITTSVCACASFAFLTIAVATDYWIKMTELHADGPNGSKDVTNTGLWNRCNITLYDHRKNSANQRPTCTQLNFFEEIEREGLGPTQTIILSMRRCTPFPLFSMVILLVGQIVCFTGHCNHRRKIHTFAGGILYVIGGLVTLIGIILFIGGITAESSSHKKTIDGQQAFMYEYGYSFHLTVASFIVSELTGVLSVYLYISRHKHAYKQKQECMKVNEQQPGPSQLNQLANHRNYSRARSLSRERSHEYSPSHSDTLYTYTPVSDTSKDMSNYNFPREPSRYTIATPVDTQAHAHNMYRGQAFSTHSVHDATDLYANRRELEAYSNRREILDTFSNRRGGDMLDTYSNRRDMDAYSNRREMDTYSNRREMDTYSNRREMDTYSNRTHHVIDDPYARRTTPV